jgi:hypothetical protein
MKFCQRCFNKMAAAWARKVNYNSKYTLDPKKMVFPCQVPIHETNTSTGQPVVRIWNCKSNKFDIYPLKEYNQKKSRGEL